MICSSNVLKRWSFQKEAHWDMIFLVLSGKMVFFFLKIYFFLGRKVRDDLSQEAHGNMTFSVYMYGCYNCGAMPFCQKLIEDQIDILERVLAVLWTFTETFTGIFMLSSRKNQETYQIGLKFDFFFNLFGWRYSTMNNLQYFVPFSPHELCLQVCLCTNKGNYFSIRRWAIIPKM